MTDIETAHRALALLDLTDLTDDCTPDAIDALCDSATGPNGRTAAVCIWPRFVAQAKQRLAGTGVRVATVVNFPEGGENTLEVESDCRQALYYGADEIDMVFAYRAYMAGHRGFAETQVVRLRELIGTRSKLKVILETGEVRDEALIRAMAEVAISAGADFIKTSTGKVAVNATPEAATAMLETIRRTGGTCGFKAAGGVRTIDDAAHYLALADGILGPDWATVERFRFGASGLLTALNAAIEGTQAVATDGY